MRFLAATILILAVAATASEHEGTFERKLSVSGPVELEVVTGSGNIDVRPGDDASVSVRGTIRVNRRISAEEAARKIQAIVNQPPVEQKGNRIRVAQVNDVNLLGHISLNFDRREVSISYELVVPPNTRLTAQAGSGDLVVQGLKGPAKASTGSGNMKLSNLGEGVRAEAGSGNIEITSVAGSVYAETGSGDIVVTTVSGAVRAHAGSGRVRLEMASPDAVEVETGSGDVEIRGAQGRLRARTGSGVLSVFGQPGDDWRLETGSGDVTLKLPASSSFTLDARTGSGSIESRLPVTMQGKADRHHLRGAVGGGGVLIRVGTGSGDIRIQ